MRRPRVAVRCIREAPRAQANGAANIELAKLRRVADTFGLPRDVEPIDALIEETTELVHRFVDAILALESVNAAHPDVEGLKHALYMRDEVIPAMDGVRAIADRLERIVADDLWPLPKYSEMLFIK